MREPHLPHTRLMLQRKHEPTLEDVVPAKDVRLSPGERVGWWLMSGRVWPADALQNPFFAYFLRTRRRLCVYSGLATGLWVVFFAIEATVLIVLDQLLAWVALLALEVLIGPFVVGLAACSLVTQDCQTILTRETFEEIAVTPIERRHLLYGVGMRTMLGYACGLGLNTFGLVLVFHETALDEIQQIPGGILMLFVLFGVVLFRSYALRVFADYGTACALRAVFFLPPGTAGPRAARDFLVPWPLLFAVLPFLSIIVVALALTLAGCLAIPLLILIPGSIALAAGLLEEHIRKILMWTAENHRGWSMIGEKAVGGVPQHIGEGWGMK